MEVPEDTLLCPITLELFRDPVVAQDGHTYERKNIEEWIQKNGTSPITNQKISSKHLVSNYTIKKMIDSFETSIRNKNYQYTLDADVKKKKGRPLFQTSEKTIYHAEWLPNHDGRPDIVLLKIEGARANKEASFYVDLSRHLHIVRTFGLVREDNGVANSIMLLQEYASEGSLYELLHERKKPLDEKILIEIFLQIIDAMSYLALNNVVHGDLACRNILVFRFDEKDSRNIVVKVTDFGLSRHSKIYTQVATVARTALNTIPVRYSAPEILSSNLTADDYTEKSDVYAMGVLMWEAYSRGTPPWANIQNDHDVIRHVRNGDMLPQPENCSPQYWNIITRTWNQQPNQRPTFSELRNLFNDQLNPATKAVPKVDTPSSKPSSNATAWYHGSSDSSMPLPSYFTWVPENFVSSNNQNQFELNNNVYDSSSPMRSQFATGANFRYPDMVGLVIQFGTDFYTIKGDILCRNQEFFALECDRKIIGFNGRCPKCSKEHMELAHSRGCYVDIKSVETALGKKEKEEKRLQGRKIADQLDKVQDNLPPLEKPKLGKNRGIEGDSNSSYMDATIFCMFTYSNIFDTLLNMHVDKPSSRKLQTLLKENIVNVLRSESGFVERDALYNLRQQLSEATGDHSFIHVEKDPSEFLRALEALFDYAPLHTIPPNQPPNRTRSNITTNIIWEMFDANPGDLKSTNITSIFRNSLAEIPAKLATIPPFLILVAPRHTHTQRSYRYIIPDRQITLDNTLVQLVCRRCGKLNPEKRREFFSCSGCFMNESSLSASSLANVSIACYCRDCIETMHDEPDLKFEHKPKHMKNIAKLNLFAVLCIELAHYVAFVKCRRANGEHEWIFFDSMSDRIDNETNVPRVSRVPDFDRWIDQAENERDFFDDLDKRQNKGKSMSHTFNKEQMRQLRLFRDGAFFFYENSVVSYE